MTLKNVCHNNKHFLCSVDKSLRIAAELQLPVNMMGFWQHTMCDVSKKKNRFTYCFLHDLELKKPNQKMYKRGVLEFIKDVRSLKPPIHSDADYRVKMRVCHWLEWIIWFLFQCMKDCASPKLCLKACGNVWQKGISPNFKIYTLSSLNFSCIGTSKETGYFLPCLFFGKIEAKLLQKYDTLVP